MTHSHISFSQNTQSYSFNHSFIPKSVISSLKMHTPAHPLCGPMFICTQWINGTGVTEHLTQVVPFNIMQDRQEHQAPHEL